MTYAFDTTDEQEDAITFKREQLNKEREAAQQPPFEDNATYVGYFIMTTIIAPLLVEFIEASLQPHADLFRRAAYADRKAADEVLKGGK